MHPNNNNNGAQAGGHAGEANADSRRARDPLFRTIRSADAIRPSRSEAMNAVMDELSGTATSRRADVFNALKH